MVEEVFDLFLKLAGRPLGHDLRRDRIRLAVRMKNGGRRGRALTRRRRSLLRYGVS